MIARDKFLNFILFYQISVFCYKKVSSGMGALRPKFLGG